MADIQKSQTDKETRIWRLAAGLGAAVILFAIVLIIHSNIQRKETRRQAEAAYNTGVQLYEQKKYAEAADAFQEAFDKGLDQASTYKSLAKIAIEIQEEKIQDAKTHLSWILNRESIAAEYKAEAKKLYEKAEKVEAEIVKKKAAERKAYEARVANSVPFVGMSESDIGNTILGRPKVKQTNCEIILIDVKVNWYFFTNDRGYCIFICRCLNNKVIEAADFRDWPRRLEDVMPGKGTSKMTQSTDSFRASDFDHPDDFYYWYYDDFYDYEEAEEYWDKHH